MTSTRSLLPTALVVAAAIAMALHGPIPQLRDYHVFAGDRWVLLASNVAFLAVGAWAIVTDRARRAGTRGERRARTAFHVGLLLTAAGSTWYHLAPDDARLVCDRLPIALTCAALLCAAHARCTGAQSRAALPAMLAAAVASVMWWVATADLRPYLLLQAAPLVLVPSWQWNARRPAAERVALAIAVLLYVVAKVCELADAAILEATGVVSGHALKHLLAAVAAAFVVRAIRAEPRS